MVRGAWPNELNLAYRWFRRLGPEDRVPDHSTFSANRHGRLREGEIYRTVFEEVVRGGMKVALIGGEGFAVDASVIDADAKSENPPIDPEQPPKARSPVDPSAAWTTRGRHKVMFGHSLNDPIDLENAVILDVEATPTRISTEVDATRKSMPPRA